MRSKQNGNALVGFISLAIALVGCGGWVANLVKLAGMGADPVTGLFVMRIVGIPFAPLGAVLGFI